MSEWLKEVWGEDFLLMQQVTHEINPLPHFCQSVGQKAEIAYRILARFKELKQQNI